jgi:hypothetical protein
MWTDHGLAAEPRSGRQLGKRARSASAQGDGNQDGNGRRPGRTQPNGSELLTCRIRRTTPDALQLESKSMPSPGGRPRGGWADVVRHPLGLPEGLPHGAPRAELHELGWRLRRGLPRDAARSGAARRGDGRTNDSVGTEQTRSERPASVRLGQGRRCRERAGQVARVRTRTSAPRGLPIRVDTESALGPSSGTLPSAGCEFRASRQTLRIQPVVDAAQRMEQLPTNVWGE